MKAHIYSTTFLSLCSLLLSIASAQESANLPDNYLKNLKNYKFKNTRGMKDLAPNRLSWVKDKYEDPDQWAMPTDEERAKLSELGIEFPDFSFIEGTDTVADRQVRQRTHTVEHIVYAVPGDAISLYPYYGLEDTFNYFDAFNHWYDYRNGGRLKHTGKDGKEYDLLDFPADREYIQITDDYGFYGGLYMSPGATGSTYKVSTPQEYIDAVTAINNAGGKGTIELTADLDFAGHDNVPIIGDDYGHRFSGTFNGNGHTIKNLKISRYDGENVGLIGLADSGAMILNLIIDKTCLFEGRLSIGLVGKLDQGSLTVRNVVMNATVRGTKDDVTEQFASAILGRAGHNGADNYLDFRDIYIGGTIGTAGKGQRYDTVLCGWFATEKTYTTSTFKNIVMNGTVHGPENLTRAKYLRRDLASIEEDISDPSTNTVVEKHSNYSIVYTNCFGNVDNNDPCWTTFSDLPQIEGWSGTTPGISETSENYGAQLLNNRDHRTWHNGNPMWDGGPATPDHQARRRAGTRGVFYFPDSDELKGDWMTNESVKPNSNGIKEYVVAADFSQTFEPDTHLDIDAMTVTEPVLAFRHIFRIRDGREQAKELYNNNNDYVRRHQHKVTARVGVNFQIRLDFPIPKDGNSGAVTNYYYNKSFYQENAPDEYHRVRQYEMRVLNEKRVRLSDNKGFKLGAEIKMHRAVADGSRMHANDNGSKEYYSMLMNDNVSGENHYVVQIVAKDDDGNVIPAANGDMVLMEYDITFLPEKGASIVTEKELYDVDKNNDNKYRHARDEYMKEKYGEPGDKIDFDEYILLNKLSDETLRKKMISYSVPQHVQNQDWVFHDFPLYKEKSAYTGPGSTNGSKMYHSFYKWPIRWSRSSYTFGYNYRGDYNMYMLATHSENVPYHAKADKWTDNADGEIGLYDRLYYKSRRQNPNAIKQGYFYYVNAATDPGVSARLNFRIDCPGSRVIVSAWVAEMSPVINEKDQPANLSFNFVAVMKGTQERVTLHNFITGYLNDNKSGNLDDSKLGQWLNVYYSFVPRLAEFYSDTKNFNDVDHFELELAHNGTSSAGSDYAIDDIRAYVVPPFAEADHEGYACEDSPLDITVQTSFETLLEKVGLPESFDENDTEKLSLYYAFVDKEKFDAGESVDEALVKVVMKGTELQPYGLVKFNNNYDKNDRYLDAKNANNIAYNKPYRYTAESGERIIRFLTQAAPSTLHLGKEYYVVFKSSVDPEDVPVEGNYDSFFDLSGKCSYNCAMIVKPSLKFKFDGILQPEFDNISICENQSPVIQVNVWSTDKDKEPVEVTKNAWFDWFDGSINEFENYRFKDYPTSLETVADDDGSEHPFNLKKALEAFRFHFAEAESVAGIEPVKADSEGKEDLEQWMLDLIDVASSPEASGRRRLMLHQSSLVLPPVNLPDGVTSTKVKVVAIPIADLYPNDGSYSSVCTSPTELGVKIGNHTPVLRHGLAGITYPADLYDVPLRIGLSQICKDNVSSLVFSKKRLDMPVRTVSSSDGKERSFSLMEEKTLVKGREENRTGCLILAQTNDPEYRHLGTVDNANQETGYLLWVGEIKELQASMTGKEGRNYFLAEFDKDFHFKEGYYYRMRFSFEESGHEDDLSEEVTCNGEDIFTLKIVPEYMKWSGAKNLSWDNDDNWQRVSSSDMKAEENISKYTHFVTDAKNEGSAVNINRKGFAPLDFSKVIIDRPTVVLSDEGEVVSVRGENPMLYLPKSDNVDVDDDYSEVKNRWTADPSTDDSDDETISHAGHHTPLIEFDMTARTEGAAENAVVRCLPWKANRCEEIHFLPGASIMNQQVLDYGKAWVDVELDPSRWYLLSSPLKDVYAGDFFLPTDNGRQETEYFQDINFDEQLHNRFAPAVYQRGWDKNQAQVFEFGKENARNAAVRTFWSHVYNDVADKYGAGNAFSIKTVTEGVAEEPDKVLFRLPKADTEYYYYTHDYSPDDPELSVKKGHKTEVEKEGIYKLNDTSGTLTSTVANAGNYFLVGNPFMCYMDLRKFLEDEANAEILEPKYWLVTEKGQIAVSLTDERIYAASPYPADDITTELSAVAPMQGFFVMTKNPATSISLHYDESMMCRYADSGDVLTAATRSGNILPGIKVTAFCNGYPSSSALIVTGDRSPEYGVEAIDNRDLDIPATVFSSNDGKAMSVNFIENAEGTEIGVIADENTATALIFEGGENFPDLFLFDSYDNSVTPLSCVNEIEVKGTVSGRFYLTAGNVDSISDDCFKWRTDGNILSVTDSSSSEIFEVTVHDIAGCLLAKATSSDHSVSIPLDKGIYVVGMKNDKMEKRIKLYL